MKKYSLLIAFFINLAGFSQNYKGSLKPLLKDGLHSLMLAPEIRSAANDNLDFLRIRDAQKNEIPYVLISNTDKRFSIFNPIKIDFKETLIDSVTSIVIENKTRRKQDHITLQIANTNVYKNYTIYGSNNKIDWFGLAANGQLTDLNSQQETTIEKTIYFPLNTYEFLKINFNDKNSLPINILKVGVYESEFFPQKLIEIDNFKLEIISVKNKNVTQLKFTAKRAHKINNISFKINTQFFLRNVKVIIKKTRKIKKRIEMYDEVILRDQLNSKYENSLVLNNLNEKEFILEIDDQDNPPLEIQEVHLFQKPIYLVANLKQQENYTLIVNNTLKEPSYDLANFITDKTKVMDKIFIADFSKIQNDKDLLKKSSFWQTSIFMWICIVLGTVVVAYFAFGLLQDINSEEKR
ncbi:DUF3999 family protein [Polaribacter sp. SA4-10]|uniref:DUF3999 family protein n=1 Tax=Polaribacter sp. SA4-10 TaxID=754397 RepID=UPI0012FBD63B|nr:DUF3999 family protein [Polaribacter sp. SA4-10]